MKVECGENEANIALTCNSQNCERVLSSSVVFLNSLWKGLPHFNMENVNSIDQIGNC